MKDNLTKTAIPALAAAVTLAMAACGSATEEASDGVASLSDSTSESSESSESSDDDVEAPEDPEQANALFVSCMKEAGFDIGLPGSSGGIALDDTQDDSGDSGLDQLGDIGSPEWAEAETECSKHLANADSFFDLSSEEKHALDDAMVEFMNCMAEHGVEVTVIGDGGIQVDGGSQDDTDASDAGTGGEYDAEKFDAAEETCSEIFDRALAGEDS